MEDHAEVQTDKTDFVRPPEPLKYALSRVIGCKCVPDINKSLNNDVWALLEIQNISI